jgi:hypothetical protein
VNRQLDQSRKEVTMPSANRTLKEGLVVGLIGYAAVAVFYAFFDFLAARGPLYTVNLLGLTVFRGLRDPTVLRLPMDIDAGAIWLFNGLHLVVSLAIGLVVTWLVSQAEGPPARARLAMLTIVAGFFITILGVGLFSSPIRDLLPWWSVVLANVLAVLVGGAYLLRKHPGLLHRWMTSPA